MIQIQMQGAVIEHIEMEAPTTEGTVEKRHLLTLHDPVSRIAISLIFDENEMERAENGDLILKQQELPKESDIAIAGAHEMPPEPPPGQAPGPAQPERRAGRGRPGR